MDVAYVSVCMNEYAYMSECLNKLKYDCLSLVYLLKIDENKEKQRYNHILKKSFFFYYATVF